MFPDIPPLDDRRYFMLALMMGTLFFQISDKQDVRCVLPILTSFIRRFGGGGEPAVAAVF